MRYIFMSLNFKIPFSSLGLHFTQCLSSSEIFAEEVLLDNVELILEAFDYLQLPFSLKQGNLSFQCFIQSLSVLFCERGILDKHLTLAPSRFNKVFII